MRSAMIYVGEQPAAMLHQHDDGSFELDYLEAYSQRTGASAISLTLPLQAQPYRSEHLFPFFFNLLPEGTNRRALCQLHRIEPDDYFSMLLEVAGTDTIGAVRVVPFPNQAVGDE